ncbi:uncharacterized protein MKZ38_007224 [Zalerion maritima]|uniref:F-box domain-containing protein n=1 Tax=Zalerion maritima TaxID=339359 RepID=A0AAD5WPB7_9PEZI|nr:uncharacterized protein MKZ38_007224 [Zalerion maritima]
MADSRLDERPISHYRPLQNSHIPDNVCAVWADDTRQEVGRRLHFPQCKGGQSWEATGGPVIFVGSDAYQITARQSLAISGQCSGPPPVLIPPEFAGSESSPLDFEMESDIGSEESRDSGASVGPLESFASSFGQSDQASHVFPEYLGVSLDDTSSSTLDARQRSNTSEDKRKNPELPRGSLRIGQIVPGTRRDLNYSLVALDVSSSNDRNLLCYELAGSSSKIRVIKTGKVKTATSTVLVTSTGLVRCKVFSSTEHPMRLEGHAKFQFLYQVKLLGEGRVFRNEECGSCIVDALTGEAFGHIVCGYPGTAFAFMAPIELIIQDIQRLLQADVHFAPLSEAVPSGKKLIRERLEDSATTPLRQMSDAAAMKFESRFRKKKKRPEKPSPSGFSIPFEPRVVVEFGSPKYFEDLADGKETTGKLDTGKKMTKRHFFREIRSDFQERATKVKAVGPQHFRYGLLSLSRHGRAQNEDSTFEMRFFSLPIEIQDMVVNELPFRSAMSLRHVSRRWRSAVKANARVITNRFLTNDPLPPLVKQLYDNKAPDLQYIDEVGHRYTVASKLANHVSRWLSEEIFQHKSINTQERRRLIQKRLIPPLFATLHFVEKFPGSLLLYLRSESRNGAGPGGGRRDRLPSSLYPFEEEMMSSYSDDILLQTQRMFEILLKFIDRIMRPMSYYGSVQKLFHGYLGKRPLPKESQGILVCFGGLEAVLLLAETSDYGQRLAIARKFVSTLRSGLPGNSIRGQKTQPPIPSNSSRVSSPLSIPVPADIAPEDLKLLLDNLPPLDKMFGPTARYLLTARSRRAVTHPGDLKNYSQSLTELVRPTETMADRLYGDGHHLFHALLDPDFGGGDPVSAGEGGGEGAEENLERSMV